MMGVLLNVIGLIPIIAFVIVVVVTRGKYKNKSNAGAFFFENNCMVLNTGIPYAIPIDEIERVELHYSAWELEHKLSYGLSVKVKKKSGKTKTTFYKGYRTAKLATPFDMQAALREKGICCDMIDG